MDGKRRVIIVGGGFAGMTCARKLASNPDLEITLIDRNNYHQFQPLLYQVATCQLAHGRHLVPAPSDRRPEQERRRQARQRHRRSTRSRSVSRPSSGETYQADYIVLAAGSQPYFFKTPGAPEHSFPLYSVDDAVRLRSRILGLFEEADRDPSLVDEGAVNFVVVGGGPTGVEVAGALAEMINTTLATEYRDLAVQLDQGQPRRPWPCPPRAVLGQGPRLRGQDPPVATASRSASAPG